MLKALLSIGLIAGVALPARAADKARATVLLVADAREADSDCPCGHIIHAVRDAKSRGVTVREVEPSDKAVTRKYAVTVVPTVLVLDASGKVLERHEGESEDTLAAIRASLERIAKSGT